MKHIFLINQAKGLMKSIIASHPRISREVARKFCRDMNTESYVYTYTVTENGISLSHLYKDKSEIEPKEAELREILKKCNDFANGKNAEMPSAVVHYKSI